MVADVFSQIVVVPDIAAVGRVIMVMPTGVVSTEGHTSLVTTAR